MITPPWAKLPQPPVNYPPVEEDIVNPDDPDLDEAVWKPMDSQIGGDHYKKLKIQPMRYSMENKLDALQHTVVKYVTRFRDKGGVQDLEKAKHCIDMLIQFELTGNLE